MCPIGVKMNELNPCECGGVPVMDYGYCRSASTKDWPLNAALVKCARCKKKTGKMVYNANNDEDEQITLKAIAEVWNAGAYG